jgi:hypothetical protein
MSPSPLSARRSPSSRAMRAWAASTAAPGAVAATPASSVRTLAGVNKLVSSTVDPPARRTSCSTSADGRGVCGAGGTRSGAGDVSACGEAAGSGRGAGRGACVGTSIADGIGSSSSSSTAWTVGSTRSNSSSTGPALSRFTGEARRAASCRRNRSAITTTAPGQASEPTTDAMNCLVSTPPSCRLKHHLGFPTATASASRRSRCD